MKKGNGRSKKKTKKKNLKNIIIICAIMIIIIITFTIIIFVNKGKNKAKIRFDTYANGIYEWQCKIDNEKIVKIDSKERIGDLNNEQGGNPVDIYVFKAQKPGKTTMKCIFVNTNNKSYAKIKYYDLFVNKKNHIIINEIKKSNS